jgi:putative aldouronate transport system permease protein
VAAVTTSGGQIPESGDSIQVSTGGTAVAGARSGSGPGSGSDSSSSPRAPMKLRKLNWRIRLRRDKSLLLMILPVVVLTLVFAYLPMFGTITAFEYYDPIYGFLHSDWLGLQNFQQLFADPAFWHALENTIVLSTVQLMLYFPIPIFLAILLNSVMSSRLRSFVQAVVYLPHFFSWVLVIAIFNQMLGGAGLLNQFLRQHNMTPWNIMTSESGFKFLVSAQSVWKEAGWGIIVFLAALAAIDPALYEAAAADGAGPWRRMWHITIPGLRGMVVLMLVLRLGNALNVGFEQFLLQRQAVGPQSAEVLDTFAYYYGIADGNFGYGAAAGLFKGVVSLILIFAANRFAHKLGEDGLYRR